MQAFYGNICLYNGAAKIHVSVKNIWKIEILNNFVQAQWLHEKSYFSTFKELQVKHWVSRNYFSVIVTEKKPVFCFKLWLNKNRV